MARTTSYYHSPGPVRGRRSSRRLKRQQVMPQPYTVRWANASRKPKLNIDEDMVRKASTSTGTSGSFGGLVDDGHPGKGKGLRPMIVAHRLPPKRELV